MTLTQLEYIIAVEIEGNFTKAAEKCFVTQPTLSMQIQKLEEELGVIIFDRSKKPIKTTPIGQEILNQAKENLHGLKRIKELVADHRNELKGNLRIGIIPTLSPYLLPLFATSFLKKYPQISLTVEEYISDLIIEKLKLNTLDAGILVTPVKDSAVTETPLFYETFVAYISTTHPLIHRDIVELENLNIDEMLLLNEGHCFREQIVKICPKDRKQNWTSQLRFESGSLETLMRIVEQNYGYTLLPELAVLKLNEDRRKYVKELNEPKPVREVSLVIHRSDLKRNLVNALKDEILINLPFPLRDKNRGRIIDWT